VYIYNTCWSLSLNKMWSESRLLHLLCSIVGVAQEYIYDAP